MNFLQVRNNIAHMLSEDPLGINNPFTHDGVNHESLSMIEPIDNIHCDWQENVVEIYDSEEDVKFSIKYQNRTEGELASEMIKIFDHLR